MRTQIAVLCFASLLALPAAAQSKGTKAPSTSGKRPARSAPKTISGLRMTYLMWQEIIEVTNGPARTDMLTQSEGVQISYLRNIPFSNPRWNQVFTGDVAGGVLKGTGGTTLIPDSFGNQAWFMLSGSAGLRYRTSSISSVSLFVPLSYRMISWRLEPGSTTNPSKDSSFSVGLGGLFDIQFSPRNSFQAGLIHQHLWKATQWSIGLQRSFR